MANGWLRQRMARIGTFAIVAVLMACGPESDADAEHPTAPVEAAGLRITAGGSQSFVSFSHSCAIVGGGVQCWGANGNGQLGDGFVSLRVPVPTRVAGLDHDVTAIAAGGAHTCAIRSGKVLCWGRNDRRQIAAVRPPIFPEPTEIHGLPEPVSQIAAGDEHNCAVSGGELYCWGLGTDGELGLRASEHCGGYRADEDCSTTPIRVEGLSGTVTDVALGSHHSCAIAGGQIYCWGRNNHGQLGVSATRTARSFEPIRVGQAAFATAMATDIAAGADHTCALVGARVWCWGAGDDGQLGVGARDDRDSPQRVAQLEPEATRISVGSRHSCATAAGRVYCWGSNSEGQLGFAGASADTPVAVAGLSDDIVDVASGADHSCAVDGAGDVMCWGANDFGQLGHGESSRSGPPSKLVAWDDGGIRDRNGDGRITIACLGDSNTQDHVMLDRTWCERLESLLRASTPPEGSKPIDWETLNRGWGGATAISLPSLRRAEQQLAYTLEFDHPDLVILAYGTNDLLQHATPQDVLLALIGHLLRAREAGVDTFVALVPPARGQATGFDEGVEATNALIRKAVRSDRVIDFESGLTSDDFHDDVHFSASGHSKRAAAAFAAVCPSCVGH